MSTFHPFPRLPAELRLWIWDLTIAPRTVSVHHAPEAASPAPMRTCAEARARYRESYTYTPFLDQARPRWVHFGLDTIQASHYDVRHFPRATLVAVRRLRLEIEDVEEQDFYFVTCSTLRADLMRALEVVTFVLITDMDCVHEREWLDDVQGWPQMNKNIQLHVEFKNPEDDGGKC